MDFQHRDFEDNEDPVYRVRLLEWKIGLAIFEDDSRGWGGGSDSGQIE